MNRFLFSTLACFLIIGCQSTDVKEPDPGTANPPLSSEDGNWVDGIASEGRWVAGLEASDDPRMVFLLDRETNWVYEIGGDARVTLERLAWRTENQLEIFGGGNSVVVHILPPETPAENAPRFLVLPAEIETTPNTSGFVDRGPASSAASGGSLTVDSIYTMKNRLKLESYQRRGPRVPNNSSSRIR